MLCELLENYEQHYDGDGLANSRGWTLLIFPRPPDTWLDSEYHDGRVGLYLVGVFPVFIFTTYNMYSIHVLCILYLYRVYVGDYAFFPSVENTGRQLSISINSEINH